MAILKASLEVLVVVVAVPVVGVQIHKWIFSTFPLELKILVVVVGVANSNLNFV